MSYANAGHRAGAARLAYVWPGSLDLPVLFFFFSLSSTQVRSPCPDQAPCPSLLLSSLPLCLASYIKLKDYSFLPRIISVHSSLLRCHFSNRCLPWQQQKYQQLCTVTAISKHKLMALEGRGILNGRKGHWGEGEKAWEPHRQ